MYVVLTFDMTVGVLLSSCTWLHAKVDDDSDSDDVDDNDDGDNDDDGAANADEAFVRQVVVKLKGMVGSIVI